MKNQILRVLCGIFLFTFFAVSCNKEENSAQTDPNENLSEIVRLEKEEGVEFFKRDFTYSSDGTNVTLTVATRNKEIFDNVIRSMDVKFTPILQAAASANKTVIANGNSGKQVSFDGEEIMVEFTRMQRANGVIGIKTEYQFNRSVSSGGRAAMSEYNFYVNHYSNHWPSTYTIESSALAARTGVHFYARWKWYQGYGSRTVCVTNSYCSYVGACSDDFDLYNGNCSWTFNVDGPYQMQVKIGWLDGSSFTDYWTY